MTQEQIKDYTLRITQANASGLVVIIYELLLDSMKEAVNAKNQDNIEECTHYMKKSRRYLEELIHGLNLSDAIGRQVAKRYISLHKQLLLAEKTLDEHIMLEVMEEISRLQPHFIRIAKEDKEAPIMANTQKVYAGLTYGKNSLTEMAVDPDSNRGYQV